MLIMSCFYSGGHFNPAVSVCVYLLGGMELVLLGPYILVQMFGGMIGAGLAKVRWIVILLSLLQSADILSMKMTIVPTHKIILFIKLHC